MKIRQNFHTHSHNSCDSACALLEDIVSDMDELGVVEYGLTDHIHTLYNLPDLERSRQDYLSHHPSEHFHFGVEASCMDMREIERIAAGDTSSNPVYGFRQMTDFTGKMAIGVTEKEIRDLRIEFVVAGVHWPLTVSMDRAELMENWLEQSLFLANHPLVDILAHPWSSLDLAVAGWYKCMDDKHRDLSVFQEVPRDFVETLGEALVSQGKLAEVNLLSFKNTLEGESLLQWMQVWKEQGVKFTFGTDIHTPRCDHGLFHALEGKLTECGFTEEDFAIPKFRVFDNRIDEKSANRSCLNSQPDGGHP
ncbi:MAG: hypothetical protein IJJ33_12020 [Victivallales bacterium]|nr:hypothetical protein [Victivallales bacterium]